MVKLRASFTNLLIESLRDLVEDLGVLGVFLASAIENFFTPIPSEPILPLIGYVAWLNRPEIFLVQAIVASTLGGLSGSSIFYLIGSRLGRPFMKRYGKYFLIGEDELQRAERWFLKYGWYSILFGRMVPGIRSVISFPAGLFRYNLKKFIALTLIGCLPWNSSLICLGYLLGREWSMLLACSTYIDVLAAASFFIIKFGRIRGRC